MLAPAGGKESLEAAVYFGADAVYLAGKSYGMRAFADNFSLEEIGPAVQFAHHHGKRVYITLNAVFHQPDFDGLEAYIATLKEAGVDALIISDPGVISMARRIAPNVPIHLSTQANTTNAHSAEFWHRQGVSRVILARELSLQEIADIRKNTPASLEFEAFVHGAMCISYSGRCLMSHVLTGRDGNRGACAQPCRWEYHVSEKGYEGEFFPVYAEERGTFVFNSKDLNMLGHLDDLIAAGVTSLKIEGRMKSAYYVACVTHAYRKALNDLFAGKTFDTRWLDEANKAGSRAYTTGFYYGNPREAGQNTEGEPTQRTYDFMGVVKGEKNDEGQLLIEQRGKFLLGDELDILSPSVSGTFTVTAMTTPEGEPRFSAPHPKEALLINCPYDLKPGDMLRKKRDIT